MSSIIQKSFVILKNNLKNCYFRSIPIKKYRTNRRITKHIPPNSFFQGWNEPEFHEPVPRKFEISRLISQDAVYRYLEIARWERASNNARPFLRPPDDLGRATPTRDTAFQAHRPIVQRPLISWPGEKNFFIYYRPIVDKAGRLPRVVKWNHPGELWMITRSRARATSENIQSISYENCAFTRTLPTRNFGIRRVLAPRDFNLIFLRLDFPTFPSPGKLISRSMKCKIGMYREVAVKGEFFFVINS